MKSEKTNSAATQAVETGVYEAWNFPPEPEAGDTPALEPVGHRAAILIVEDVLAEERDLLGYRWSASIDFADGSPAVQEEMAPISKENKRFKCPVRAFDFALARLCRALSEREKGRRDIREFRYRLSEAGEERRRQSKGSVIRIIPMEGEILDVAVEALRAGCPDVESDMRILPAWREEIIDGAPATWSEARDERGDPIPIRARVVKCSGEKAALLKLALGWRPHLLLLADRAEGMGAHWLATLTRAAEAVKLDDKGKLFMAEPTFKLHASDAMRSLPALDPAARSVIEGIIVRTVASGQADFLEGIMGRAKANPSKRIQRGGADAGASSGAKAVPVH
jgi:hypothetical protein